MRKAIGTVITICIVGLNACSRLNVVNDTEVKAEIIQILNTQNAAWNAGDIDGFMASYLASEDLRFASGGKIKRGWQETSDGYKARYPDKATMGILDFNNLEVKILSAEYAQVFGRWELTRAYDKPGGLFTLLLNKRDGKWVIVSDHTSSDDSTNPVITDPVTIDKDYPPTTVELDFISGGSALNGHLYLADGAGPHPTVIMLHGFPGYEKNLDIAQAARRMGFNVLFFHYRGAWGSEGDFSLNNVIEDALAAAEFIRTPDSVAKYRIDPKRISFVGHSLGGFAALAAGAKDKQVGCVVGMSPVDYGIRGSIFESAEGFADADGWEQAAKARAGFSAYVDGERLLGLGPLKGITGERMMAEIADNIEAFSVSKQAGEFAGRNVFLLAAKDDTVLSPEIYHTALVDAFEQANDVNLTHKILEGDHSYSWTRMELTGEVVKWLGVNCR